MTFLQNFYWLKQQVILGCLLPVCSWLSLAMIPMGSPPFRKPIIHDVISNHAAQVADIWQILAQVSWPADDSFRPRFSDPIQKLNGSVVTISGYLIPTDMHGAGNTILLSAYPVQSCFFCGGAGLESVVEIYPRQKTIYLMKKLTFRGTLVLNDHDPEHLLYQLKNAERIFGED